MSKRKKIGRKSFVCSCGNPTARRSGVCEDCANEMLRREQDQGQEHLTGTKTGNVRVGSSQVVLSMKATTETRAAKLDT